MQPEQERDTLAPMSTRINYAPIVNEYARHRNAHPGVLRQFIQHSKPVSDSLVLEVGCGTGNYIAALYNATNCHAFGLDRSREMLRADAARDLPLQLFNGAAEQVALQDNYFDFIYSVDVMHHMRTPQAFYTAAQRALKPGGLLCTVTDSQWNIRQRRPLATYFPEIIPTELQRYPTISSLRTMMRHAGFNIIQETQVEMTFEIDDAQSYRDRAYSSLHLIPEQAFKDGLANLEKDLEQGPVPGFSSYTLLWGNKQSI